MYPARWGNLTWRLNFDETDREEGGMSKRRDRDRDRAERDRDRARREEENERRAATERRGEELREAWRQHHPKEERGKGRPKRGRPS